MNRLAPLIAIAALIAVAGPAVASETSARAEALIAAAKAAMGGAGWDRLVTWRERDQITAGGLQGVATSVVDLPSLRNSGSFSLGPVSGGGGWDGKQAWTIDSNGEVRLETSGEAMAEAIQDAYRGAMAYFFVGRYPDTREYAGERQADGKTYEAVRIAAKGAEPFEVWFDPVTHLIAREVQPTGPQRHAFIYSDYATFGGVLVPATTIDRTGADPKYDVVEHVASVTIEGPQPASAYRPPASSPNAARWPAGVDSVTVPFRLIDNHIYVDASINGAAPLPFMFDTGATDGIQVAVARTLGITVEGALPGGGFGDKLEDVGFAKVKSVSLGGLTLGDQVFATENWPAWTVGEGAPPSGLLGYEFAKSAVLTIDYQKRTLTFTRAQAFRPPRDAQPIAITFAGHVPIVAGALDGVRGEFQLDTGSRGALTLMAPFAQANDLVARYGATHLATIGFGVGGPTRALLARAGKFTLGGVTIEAPVAAISTDRGGAAQSLRTAGNIGGEILKRFTVTLDYAHQKAWLQPNAHAQEREVFDRSGLWLARARDGAIGIADVTTLSAAAQAGLLAGEEIVSVDGKPAKQVSLIDLGEAFKGPVGAKFTLAVRGRGGERTVTLVLADEV